jgi:hypothetical protein
MLWKNLLAGGLAFACVSAATTAHSGEIVNCAEKPSGGSRWYYRIVDGRQCWFQDKTISRGEQKPREELRWNRPGDDDPLPAEPKTIPMIYDPVKPNPVADLPKPLFDALPTPLSEFEERWNAMGRGAR